jgi:predicted RNase H-like HicB family nuclease
MRSYLALVEPGDESHSFGIRFPDLPGVFSAADSRDDIIPNAIEALQLWAEDEALPEPSNHAAVLGRSDVRKDLAKGWYLIDVPVVENDPKVVRANVTFERGILDAIDATAKIYGLTRSSFLALAARSQIERIDRLGRLATAKNPASAPVKAGPAAKTTKAAAKSASSERRVSVLKRRG